MYTVPHKSLRFLQPFRFYDRSSMKQAMERSSKQCSSYHQ